MKTLFLLLLTLATSFAAGAQGAAPAKVDFCGQQYELPAGATLESPYEVKSDKFSLMLMYVNPAALRDGTPAEFAKQRRKKMKGEPLQELNCFIQDSPAKAYKFSYRTDTGMAYEMLAYGVTKGQPVWIQLTTETEPYKSADIPDFARQFVRLEQ
jgi:hypothetical protein